MWKLIIIIVKRIKNIIHCTNILQTWLYSILPIAGKRFVQKVQLLVSVRSEAVDDVTLHTRRYVVRQSSFQLVTLQHGLVQQAGHDDLHGQVLQRPGTYIV